MISLRLLCVPFLGLCVALPAQQEEKPKADAKKVESQAPAKDDASTVNDPAIVAIDAFLAKKNVDKKTPSWRQTLSEPPKLPFDAKSEYFLHMETSVGSLKAKLYADTAPMHVSCGIYLARLGFFDDLKFHRIIKNFMAQGGDPTGTGSGGPGYMIDGEYGGGRKHDKPGLLSTANTGRPKTDGSQFFLTFVPTPWLDGKHTLWGEVVEGMETVKKLEGLGVDGGSGMVANPPTIKKAWVAVVQKPKADDKAEKPKVAEPAKKEDEKK
jgi:cyclophilin family peptidyl-prolyl cis-trans isomerase